jgi:hypothetical protein
MPSSNVIVQVSKFISKNKETISASEHLDVLSIFPERRKRFVETIRKFSPEICIQQPIIKEVLPYSPKKELNLNIKTTTNLKKKEESATDSVSESNDSNYNVNSSSRKRVKKKSVKSRKSVKKQKTNSADFIVSKQSQIERFLNR